MSDDWRGWVECITLLISHCCLSADSDDDKDVSSPNASAAEAGGMTLSSLWSSTKADVHIIAFHDVRRRSQINDAQFVSSPWCGECDRPYKTPRGCYCHGKLLQWACVYVGLPLSWGRGVGGRKWRWGKMTAKSGWVFVHRLIWMSRCWPDQGVLLDRASAPHLRL